MPSESKHIDLNRLFEGSQRRMVAELMSIRQAVDHGATLGDETEVAWVKFLNTMLPDRYRVCDGFVVDADGRCSVQIDAIVFDGNTHRHCFEQRTSSTFLPRLCMPCSK